MPAITSGTWGNFNVEKAESTLQKIATESGDDRESIELRVDCWLGMEKCGNWIRWADAHPQDEAFIEGVIGDKAKNILMTFDTFDEASRSARDSIIKYAPQLARTATNVKTFGSLNEAYDDYFTERTDLQSKMYDLETGLILEKETVRSLEQKAISCDEQSLPSHMSSLRDAMKSHMRLLLKDRAQPWMEEVEGKEFQSEILPRLQDRVIRARGPSQKR